MARSADVPEKYDPRQFRALVSDIEKQMADGTKAIGIGYSASNFTEARTIDAGAATLSDVANVLATLINDLKKAGRLG